MAAENEAMPLQMEQGFIWEATATGAMHDAGG
jgi:hypothetical protein